MKRSVKNAVVYLFVLWCVAPILWLISTSLKSDVDAFSPQYVWFFTPDFSSYREAWVDGAMGSAMVNSATVAVVSSVLGIVAGLPLAYLITQVWPQQSAGAARLALATLLLTTVPPVLSLTPFYRTFFHVGLTGNVVGLTIVHTFYATLLAVLIFRSFLVNFPLEIREAALLDGLGEWATLFRTVLPNAWGGLFATFVLALIQSWNEFLYALVLTSGGTQTAPVTIAGFLSFFGTNWARLTAAGVIGALPIVVFAILVRKHMARGLSFGGVK
ncbi:carbohydrate ABC transporter permease [Micromonospora olivasterospora]|uniref:Multiple sugar transport system permease protein/sorbitol/mannitol transport system permease protein n=1 Tax=Micromonospora olivasterospora TaxID=1880 RepID=A0A562I940_MICOL|nr:carbohydrate ABC transporter permease [Micromonospora olivasterospora]TWH67154.1 multiple sugar transport system permease protein/sorbitol/mannitol transport system permease protein [Micromonospora olivasterospora]